jgi:hypothetical protein
VKLEGFPYVLEDEKLIEYGRLTIAERLTWLEEAVAFTEAARGQGIRETPAPGDSPGGLRCAPDDQGQSIDLTGC